MLLAKKIQELNIGLEAFIDNVGIKSVNLENKFLFQSSKKSQNSRLKIYLSTLHSQSPWYPGTLFI